MNRRPYSLRSSLVAFAMLLTTLPALAFLELPTQTQFAFNEILVAIDTVANPSANQQLAQRRVNKSTAKLFRSGRTLRQCLKDMEKTLRKAGTLFEDAELEGQSVPELRAALLQRLRSDMLDAVDDLDLQIEIANPSTEDDPPFRIVRPIDKAGEKLSALSEATSGATEIDAKTLRRAFRDFGQVAELLERSARRAKKAGFGDFSVAIPTPR